MSHAHTHIKRRLSWADAFYTLAALSFAIVTITVILGEKPRKMGPAVSIDRIEYLKFYVFPVAMLLLGWALSLREKSTHK